MQLYTSVVDCQTVLCMGSMVPRLDPAELLAPISDQFFLQIVASPPRGINANPNDKIRKMLIGRPLFGSRYLKSKKKQNSDAELLISEPG